MSAQPPPPTLAALEAWASYGKDRFDAMEGQLREFRGWARQLVAAIGLVVGLELTLVGRILFDVPPSAAVLWTICVSGLLATAGFQIHTFFKLLAFGYVGTLLDSPGAPRLFWKLAEESQDALNREIGLHYATSYDDMHALSNSVAGKVAEQAKRFGYSLYAFCGFLAVSGILAFSNAQENPRSVPFTLSSTSAQRNNANADRRSHMPTDKNPSGPPAPAPADQGTSSQPAGTPAGPAAVQSSEASTMPALTVPLERNTFSAEPQARPTLPHSRVPRDEVMKLEVDRIPTQPPIEKKK